VASELAFTQDANKAKAHIAQLCGVGATDVCPQALAVVSATLQSAASDNLALQRLTALNFVISANTSVPPSTSGGTTTTGPGLLQSLQLPLMVCGVVIVFLAVVGFVLYRRSMGGSPAAFKPAQAARVALDANKTDFTAPGALEASPTGGLPIQQFMTTYALGDDHYDDSFTVDGPDGMFLGECGMGISETIGVGDPKKVMAFEVWLFDKNDIRTVTRVLMSEHAFRDEALKSRLAAKGDPVMVKSGDTFSMETATLTITARVVDMAYGTGPLPPNSYFERLTIELAAYSKNSPAPVA
jgi:hypothetical protein